MEKKSLKNQLAREKARLYPKILAIVSAGGMEDTHLLPNMDYSAAIGITIPLFDIQKYRQIQRAQIKSLQ